MSSFSPTAKRDMLNALSPDTMKLHTGYPGMAGSNELTGGTPAYAPKPCTFGLSTAGEARALSASVVFDTPAATIQWATVWDGSYLVCIAPIGGSPKEFSADLSANTIKVPAHGFSNGDKVVFFSTTPPAPLVAGTVYFVVSATTDDFQVSATSGGSAINLTANAADDCLVSKIVPRVYAAQDTQTITAYSLGIPY